jgi:hypothetical protein
MPWDDTPGRVETSDFGINNIWNALQTFLRKDATWKSVSQDDKDQWFVKTDDSIIVSCDSTEQDVTKCEILPSSIEERPYGFGMKVTYKLRKNARIRFSKRVGIEADHEFTDTSSLHSLLRKKLRPSPRPAAKEPERRWIKRMELQDTCETQDEILDFMVYYKVNFVTNANEEIICWLGNGVDSYQVCVEPKHETRAGTSSARVITYKNPFCSIAYNFSTVESLISALRDVGLQVNTDVDNPGEVSRPAKLRSVLQRVDTYLDRITLH